MDVVGATLDHSGQGIPLGMGEPLVKAAWLSDAMKPPYWHHEALDCLCLVCWFSSVPFSCSVVSNSLQPRGPQHARPPCPSPTSKVYPNSCPSSRWCHPTISSSFVTAQNQTHRGVSSGEVIKWPPSASTSPCWWAQGTLWCLSPPRCYWLGWCLTDQSDWRVWLLIVLKGYK